MTSNAAIDMKTIEKLAGRLSERRAALADAVKAAQAEIDGVRARVLPGLREHIAAAAKAEAKLRQAIIDGADQFHSPRTRIMHGLRVGWRKGRPVLTFSDPDAVVALIDKHLGGQAPALVKETRKPVKSALAKLDPRTLKKIGVRVSDGVDEPVIEPTDGEIERMTKALLASMNDMAQA